MGSSTRQVHAPVTMGLPRTTRLRRGSGKPPVGCPRCPCRNSTTLQNAGLAQCMSSEIHLLFLQRLREPGWGLLEMTLQRCHCAAHSKLMRASLVMCHVAWTISCARAQGSCQWDTPGALEATRHRCTQHAWFDSRHLQRSPGSQDVAKQDTGLNETCSQGSGHEICFAHCTSMHLPQKPAW